MTKEEAVKILKSGEIVATTCDMRDYTEAREMSIKALEQDSDEDYANRFRLSIIGEFLGLRDIAGRYPDQPKRVSKNLKEFLKGYGYDDEELEWADNDMFVKGWYCASHALYEGLEKILSKLCTMEKETGE